MKGSAWEHQGHIQDPLMGLLEASICFIKSYKMVHWLSRKIWISFRAQCLLTAFIYTTGASPPEKNIVNVYYGWLEQTAPRLAEDRCCEITREDWSARKDSRHLVQHIWELQETSYASSPAPPTLPRWSPLPPLAADDEFRIIKESKNPVN